MLYSSHLYYCSHPLLLLLSCILLQGLLPYHSRHYRHAQCVCVFMIDKQGERERDERGVRYRREGDGGRKGEKSKDFSLLDLL